MPAWLLGALALLRNVTVGTPARAALTGVTAGGLLPGLGGIGIPGVDLFPDDTKRRRRRRRALTASDRADIAFIAGTLDKSAAKSFALIIAARP